MYKVSMEEARWETVCPGTFIPVLTLHLKTCPLVTLFTSRGHILNKPA